MLTAAVFSITASIAAMAGGVDARACRTDWPPDEPTGVLVVVAARELLDGELAAIDAISERARGRGLIVMFPVVDCRRPGACFADSDVDAAVDVLKAEVRTIERQAGRRLDKRQVVGIASGGVLLGAALQRGLLDAFSRVGIIAGAAIGAGKPTRRMPRVFLEVGDRDRRWGMSTRALYELLSGARPGDDLRFRRARGDHVFDETRARDFLDWYWGVTDDVGIAQPRVRPP